MMIPMLFWWPRHTNWKVNKNEDIDASQTIHNQVVLSVPNNDLSYLPGNHSVLACGCDITG